MEEVAVESRNLADACQLALGRDGVLSQALDGYVVREPQVAMARAVARAIDAQQTLVVEAGTGTGKTFAYLIPAILSGKKILISTATKTLQDQLVAKDLPFLSKHLGSTLQIQNLKGRANYICRYRAGLYAKEGQFVNPECAHDIAEVYASLPQLITGERNEVNIVREDSQAWPYVTSSADNCLGRDCPDFQDCFLMKARNRAMQANIVVINHHLFFADSRLKQDGFGELLPNADVVILDEAHKVYDIASNFHTKQFSTRKLRYLMDDILRNWPILDLVNQPFKEQSQELDKLIDKILLLLRNESEKIAWQRILHIQGFRELLLDFTELVAELLECMPDASLEDNQGLQRCKLRLLEMQELLKVFNVKEHVDIRWVEVFKHTVVLHCTPFCIDDQFKQQLSESSAAFIFTSATLTVNNSFNTFLKPLGIEKVEQLQLASPFDFAKQTLLFLPREIPDPKSNFYYPVLIEKVLPILKACGGRTFFLFTSHSALRKSAKILEKQISYPLLIQGEEPKSTLLAKFREYKHAILLGSATFWEGVDVKGEALSCVIIDKIPFVSPRDPVVSARSAYLEKNGQSGFDELSLPGAVISLKQGIGRLIRDSSDLGVLVIADPRIIARNYAGEIFASIPPLPKTRDINKVLAFIQTMALT